jgi:hypothetical protein
MRDIEKIAAHLQARNAIDHGIAAIINRPMTSGHLGEWLASKLFDIELEPNAVTAAIDGRFATGALAGKTVNVKWYLKREGLLDVSVSDVLDYYLVLSGPASPLASSRDGVRPWCISAVYLFDARDLLADLQSRNLRTGVAASVRTALWRAAEIYPTANNPSLVVGPEQAALLELFAPRDATS